MYTMDTLPIEILDLIAVGNPADYNAFVRAVPMYARADTIGRRFDRMAEMGYDWKIRGHDDGYLSISEWLFRGEVHRLDGPAQLRIGASDCDSIAWYMHGRLHRDVGPARISQDGVLYCRNGMAHREHAPAYIGCDFVMYCAFDRIQVIVADDGVTYNDTSRLNDPNHVYPDSLSYDNVGAMVTRHARADGTPFSALSCSGDIWFHRGGLYREITHRGEFIPH